MDGNPTKEKEDRHFSSSKGDGRYIVRSYASGREEFCECRDIFPFDVPAAEDRMEIDDEAVVDYLWPHSQPRSLGRTAVDQSPISSSRRPMEVGNDTVIVQKLKNMPIQQGTSPTSKRPTKHFTCLEYRENYKLIKNTRMRNVLLIGLLMVLLPAAYLTGLYVSAAYFNGIDAVVFGHGSKSVNEDAADKENKRDTNPESFDQDNMEQMETSNHPTHPLTGFPSVISNSDEATDNVLLQPTTLPPTMRPRTSLPTPSPVHETSPHPSNPLIDFPSVISNSDDSTDYSVPQPTLS